MTKEELKDKAHSLPLHPGVYIMMDASNTVIYVGKAKALRNRVSQYFLELASHTEKTRAMVSQIDHFDVILADSEFEALVLECSLIKRHKPKYNILLKDDKGYPYVRLNLNARYPRFSVVGRTAQDGARYFGPYGTRGNTNEILDAVSLALHLPTCKKQFPRDIGKERPCLNHHLGNCDGWCRPEMTEEAYRERIAQAVQLLEGDFAAVEQQLREQMECGFRGAALRGGGGVPRPHQGDPAAGLPAEGGGLLCGRMWTYAACFWAMPRAALPCFTFWPVIWRAGIRSFSPLLWRRTGERYCPLWSSSITAVGATCPGGFCFRGKWRIGRSCSRCSPRRQGRKVEVLVPQRGAQGGTHPHGRAERRRRGRAGHHPGGAPEQADGAAGQSAGTAGNAPPHRVLRHLQHGQRRTLWPLMTVFLDGKPLKRDYRYYKLKDMAAPDDYASMDQVLTPPVPALAGRGREVHDSARTCILMDGGLGQVPGGGAGAGGFWPAHLPVFGMVKDDRHRTRALVAPDGREIGIQSSPALFSLIGRMQEETHRAAITFHHKQHQKSSKSSALDPIPGVGPTRKTALLKQFKSVKAIRAATAEQLGEVIGPAAGRSVYDYFHREEEG